MTPILDKKQCAFKKKINFFDATTVNVNKYSTKILIWCSELSEWNKKQGCPLEGVRAIWPSATNLWWGGHYFKLVW